MDSIIYVPSAILSSLIIISYLIICARTPRRFDLWIMFNVVLYSAGVVAGVLLIVSTVVPGLKARLSGIEIYIFMAGLAMLAISTRAILNDVFGWPKPPGPPTQ